MSPEATRMRAHLLQVAKVKQAAAHEDAAYHLALPIGERIEQALRHSQQLLDAFGGNPAAPDDDAEVWSRVNTHLRSRRP